ncbi:MAG TPA: carboxypeptidase regulatory-like domain-containing protein [Herpetosiphonaceae bacterium]
MVRVLIMLLSILSLPGTAEAGRGDLTIVVRDRDGERLPGVVVALIHDTDDGRVLIGETRTDAQGQIHYPALPWGLYIVQFRGTALDGRSILPPDQQNLGLLDDGSGVGGGFGVRFAEVARTELFVLATVPGEAHAVPMFDDAPHAQATPEPIDPLLVTGSPDPVPAPSHAPLSPAARRDGEVAVFLVLAGGCLVTIGLGVWRSHQARKEAR